MHTSWALLESIHHSSLQVSICWCQRKPIYHIHYQDSDIFSQKQRLMGIWWNNCHNRALQILPSFFKHVQYTF